MKARIFQVDAFARRPFEGNPASIVVLERWIPDDVLQSIAVENNQSETAYLVPHGEEYELRWFTTVTEVDLCGHATLGAGYVVMQHLQPERRDVSFFSRAGRLGVSQVGANLFLDFPSRPASPIAVPDVLLEGMVRRPLEVLAAHRDWVCLYASEQEVRELVPRLRPLKTLERPGVIATAPGSTCDFVSRFFAPALGVDEDPVTGSAFCTLAPFWAHRLGKDRMHARQVSRRGGEVLCEDRGERVSVGGQVVPYLEGTLTL
jgi:predicted PhzF superfamily epimerase YddE/YHI9